MTKKTDKPTVGMEVTWADENDIDPKNLETLRRLVKDHGLLGLSIRAVNPSGGQIVTMEKNGVPIAYRSRGDVKFDDLQATFNTYDSGNEEFHWSWLKPWDRHTD